MSHYVIHLSDEGTTLYAFTKRMKVDISPDRVHLDIPASRLKHVTPSMAETIATGLKSLHYQKEPCLLIIPASWCYSASWHESSETVQGLSRKKRKQQRAYEMERYLPFDCESLISSFLTVADVQESYDVLGVALEKDLIQKLQKHFTSVNIKLGAILPEAILCYQATRQPSMPANESITWLWRRQAAQGECIDLIHQVDGRSISWTHDILYEKGRRLQLEEMAAKGPVTEINQRSHHQNLAFPPEVFPLIADIAREKRQPLLMLDPQEAAAEGETRTDFPFNDTRNLKWLYAASIILCLCLCASAYIRLIRAKSSATFHNTEQKRVYRSLFPDAAFPPDIHMDLSRRKRRHEKWKMDQAKQHSESKLKQLHQLMAAMPQHSRFQLLELRFEGNWLYLSGNATSHAEADRLAIALRKTPGFEVAAPGTQKLRTENAVAFNIKINLTNAAAPPLQSEPVTSPVLAGTPKDIPMPVPTHHSPEVEEEEENP